MSMPTESSNTYISNGGQQVNADYIGWVVNIDQRRRESVRVNAFTRDDINRLREEYVPTTALGGAVAALRACNAVALIGTPGCGRRITGGAAILEVGATPHYPIYLDPDDDHRDLPETAGCGYLMDIDEEAVREISGIRDLIAAYHERLAAAGAYLVVTATLGAWRALGQSTGLEEVTVRQPDSVDVFRAHLRYLRPAEADGTAARPDVVEILAGTSPSDAVRLVDLVHAAMSARGDEDPIDEAIAAYHNWSDHLAEWFASHKNGYHRALLISAAALDGANAAGVFLAADRLSDRVDLPRERGGGLVGDGVSKLLGEIGANLSGDGRICLRRPAYSVSVLDHVWQDRPHLRADLKGWLIDLPRSLDTSEATYVGGTLVNLAVRQGDATLITGAISFWGKQEQASHELAAATLTSAAVSDSIGRAVRRTMYNWATAARTDPGLQLILADVCGGQFGRRFPSNAMTRLRHLAGNGGMQVCDRVVASLQTLAAESGLRNFMLREIVAWTAADSQVHAAGISAFLALVTGSASDLVPRTPSNDGQIDLLAEGFRAALRDPNYVLKAREACCGWLEAVAQGQLPMDMVTDVIARTCQDSHDIGQLASVALQWGHARDQQPTLIPREEIMGVLLEKLARRDPLVPGLSAAVRYQTAYETSNEADQ